MTAIITVHRAGPAMTVQDLGRPGYMAQGLSTGGAADPLALSEAAALLGLAAPRAAIEMAGLGGVFACSQPMRFCLTGAPMQARLDSAPLQWNTVYLAQPGQRIDIGGAVAGTYGYLSFAGALQVPHLLGSQSAHLATGIGRPLAVGDQLELAADAAQATPARTLAVADRFSGGVVRLMPGPQSDLFDAQTCARFAETEFTRGPQGNRQGVRLDHDSGSFSPAMAAGLVSDFIACGDVQITGEGVPYVLLAECQTIGGYPRIGTVLPQDLPKVAQLPPGGKLRFCFVTMAQAEALWRPRASVMQDLRAATKYLLRDPRDMADLLSYQLISGMTCGDDLERL